MNCPVCKKEISVKNKFCSSKCYKQFFNVDKDTPISSVKKVKSTIDDIPMEDI